MSNEPLVNPFDYHPVLEIQSDKSFAVGFMPSHSNIGIVDENGRSFKTARPPAMMLVKLDITDQGLYGSIGNAISHMSLEIVARVMLDFRHRPWTLLRGVSLIMSAQEPPVQAAFIRRLSAVLERGEPCTVQSAQFLDLSGAVSHQLQITKQFGGPGVKDFQYSVERGIQIVREAAERDAKTAMSVVSGEPHDYERELQGDNRDEIEGLLRAAAYHPHGLARPDPFKISDSNFGGDRYVELKKNPGGAFDSPSPDLGSAFDGPDKEEDGDD